MSTALLVVLDAMTPAERVAFVLHDIFAVPFGDIAGVVGRSPAAVRQLAASARRRVAQQRDDVAPLPEHDDVVRAFVAATAGGDLGRLVTLLDPSITLRSDGGGRVSAALNPIAGPEKVARFLLGVLTKRPTWEIRTEATADGLGFTVRRGRRSPRRRQPAGRRRPGHRRLDRPEPGQARPLELIPGTVRATIRASARPRGRAVARRARQPPREAGPRHRAGRRQRVPASYGSRRRGRAGSRRADRRR